jgi:hypothetical protein
VSGTSVLSDLTFYNVATPSPPALPQGREGALVRTCLFTMSQPVFLIIESSAKVVVERTRLDTTQPALALMTTLAYPAA